MPVDTSDYQELLDILASRRAEIEAYCASGQTWEQLTEWCTNNDSYFTGIYGTYLEGEQRVKNSLPFLLDDLLADGVQDSARAYSYLMTELVPAPVQAPQLAQAAAVVTTSEWDEGYGLFRRYNDYLRHYEFAPTADAEVWECFIDGRWLRYDADSDSWVAGALPLSEVAQAPVASPTPALVAEWDEGYGLFRRYNDYLRHYEFAPTAVAEVWECFIDGRWLRYDDQSESWVPGTLPLPGAAQPASAAQPPDEPAEPTSWGGWSRKQGEEVRYGLTEQGPWIYTDGAAALAETEIAEQVTTTLQQRYPNADVNYLRTMAAHYVAETAGTGE
jgi:hypothetical protein